jgi:hypothetical protein
VALSKGVPGLVGWRGILTISTKTLTRKEDLLRTQLLYQTSELYYSQTPTIERSSASFFLAGTSSKSISWDAAGYRTTHHYISHHSVLQRWKFIVTCSEYRSRQSTKDPVAADSPSARPEHAMTLFPSRNRSCPSHVRYSQRQHLRE